MIKNTAQNSLLCEEGFTGKYLGYIVLPSFVILLVPYV